MRASRAPLFRMLARPVPAAERRAADERLARERLYGTPSLTRRAIERAAQTRRTAS